MKYYYINHFVEKNVNKSSIQIYSLSPKHDVFDDKGVYAFGRIDFPEISEIKYLLLDKENELQDILTAPMLTLTGILINYRTKNVFSQFKLPPHKFYPAYVKDFKGNVYEYYWLQTSKKRDLKDYLDYQKSQFYWKKDPGDVEREDIEINSIREIEDFKMKLSRGQGVKIKTAVLSKEFADLNIDLFKIGRLSTDWIISERLKEALENAYITGISFKEASNLIVDE